MVDLAFGRAPITARERTPAIPGDHSSANVWGDLGHQQTVRFRADLSPWLGDPPPSLLRLTGIDGFLLPTHPDQRWLVAGRAGQGSSPEDLVRRGLGVEVAVEVLGAAEWVAGVRQAERILMGRVFLAGDAAHQVTPVGGTGVTSGMTDAANLAWKLAAVIQGWGGPDLLETYRTEREPVARDTCAVNLEMWHALLKGEELGFDLRWLEFGYRYASSVIAGAPPRPADRTAIFHRPPNRETAHRMGGWTTHETGPTQAVIECTAAPSSTWVARA